ncbi:unnamed protein product [Malus baccata var. baccata]
MVNQVLIYNGYGVNLMFEKAAERMRIIDCINQSKITLHTFVGTQVRSVGTVKLAVQVKPYNIIVYFHIMDYLTPNKAILGQNWLYKL